MMEAVFLDCASVHPEDLDLTPLREAVERLHCHDHTPPEAVLDRIRDTGIVITNKVVLDAGLLEAVGDSLQLVCVAATGTNNIDLAAANRLGIPVCNVRGYATPSVVEHVFALILALARRLNPHREAARRRWPNARIFCVLDVPFEELAGRTLGIVGFGELGRAVAKTAGVFGMEVRIAEHRGAPSCRPGRVPFEEVLAEADVLTLHCPLTPQTRHLIDSQALEAMKPGALLINTARGGLVEETALLEALRSGHLGGAGLDVLAEEPPPADHPLLQANLPNLIVTPHVAWAARAARQRLIEGIAENIRAFRAGRPVHLVAGAPA